MLESLGFLRKKRREVGVEVAAERLTMACTEMGPRGPVLTACHTESCGRDQRVERLSNWINRLGLQKSPCHLVLTPDSYQVLQVEKPAVPDDELRDAARWRVRDMLDYPLDEAVIDCFAIPSDALRGRQAQLSVVCARKNVLQDLVGLVEAAGLRLRSIDITELALRNLLALRGEDNTMQCVLLLTAEGGLILLLKQGSVYLSRKLEKGRFRMGPGMDPDVARQMIALEVQRSFDYLESQLAQVPPNTIHMATDFQETELARGLASDLGITIVSLAEAGFPVATEQAVSAHGWVACGAALRGSLPA